MTNFENYARDKLPTVEMGVSGQATEACVYIYVYIYTPRTKVFNHHENIHPNSIKLELFKKGTCPQTVEKLFFLPNS